MIGGFVCAIWQVVRGGCVRAGAEERSRIPKSDRCSLPNFDFILGLGIQLGHQIGSRTRKRFFNLPEHRLVLHSRPFFTPSQKEQQEIDIDHSGQFFNKERAVGMASTSNGGQIPTDVVNAMPENSTFDWNQDLADTAFRRNVLRAFDYLEAPEGNDPLPPRTDDTRRASVTDLFQISENEEPVSANSVPMELLNLEEQEKADLLVVYPKAKVEGNCITTTHHVVVVKRLLCDLTLYGIEGVRHPKAYARLLRRLSGLLRSCFFYSDSSLNRADYASCLHEMLKDMEETWEMLERDGNILKELDEIWGPDGYVYVRRGTDTYVHCLLSAAAALNCP